MEWLYDKWGVEKHIDRPACIVGVGCGILRAEDGELTQAGKNVVDTCFSLYHLREETGRVIMVGGRA